MNRVAKTDQELDALNEERDHLAIQISLLADAQTPDRGRLALLRRDLDQLERRIRSHRPDDA